MYKKIIILLSILMAVSLSEGKSSYRFIKPDHHGKKVKLRVKGKDRTYYKLDIKNPIEIVIEGPTVLKVYTRLEMTDQKPNSKVDYKIFCLRDGKKTHFTRSTKISSIAEFPKEKNSKLGRGRSFNLKIGPGKHSIKLFIGEKDKKVVYVRLLKKKSQVSKVDRVAVTPIEYTKQVPILVKEQQYEYYRAGGSDSLSLKLIGPASVKVLARLEYDITNNGGDKFRVEVNEDGRLKNTYLLTAKPSQSAVYAAPGVAKTLSNAETFYIEVPKGQHTYTFKVMDNGRNILLKFYIPSSALDNKP